MAETANSEFWRELKPIEQKFRPGALPEAYIADAATDDDRPGLENVRIAAVADIRVRPSAGKSAPGPGKAAGAPAGLAP
jgi:hypothetical protein